jgi:hypothetical protein
MSLSELRSNLSAALRGGGTKKLWLCQSLHFPCAIAMVAASQNASTLMAVLLMFQSAAGLIAAYAHTLRHH